MTTRAIQQATTQQMLSERTGIASSGVTRYLLDLSEEHEAELGATDVDARIYGVVADGSTNNYAAMAAAIRATPDNGRLLLPRGTILIRLPYSGGYTPLEPGQISLVGQGRGQTVLLFATPDGLEPVDETFNAIVENTVGSVLSFSGLTIQMQATLGSRFSYGIYMVGGGTSLIMRDFEVLGFGNAIKTDDNGDTTSGSCELSDGVIEAGYGGGGNCVLHIDGSDPDMAVLVMRNVEMRCFDASGQSHCVYADRGVSLQLSQLRFLECAGGYGLHYFGGAGSGIANFLQVSDCYFGRDLQSGATVGGGMILSNCVFDQCGVNVYGECTFIAPDFRGAGGSNCLFEANANLDGITVIGGVFRRSTSGSHILRNTSSTAGVWRVVGSKFEGGDTGAARIHVPGGKVLIDGAIFDDRLDAANGLKTSFAPGTSVATYTKAAGTLDGTELSSPTPFFPTVVAGAGNVPASISFAGISASTGEAVNVVVVPSASSTVVGATLLVSVTAATVQGVASGPATLTLGAQGVRAFADVYTPSSAAASCFVTVERCKFYGVRVDPEKLYFLGSTDWLVKDNWHEDVASGFMLRTGASTTGKGEGNICAEAGGVVCGPYGDGNCPLADMRLGNKYRSQAAAAGANTFSANHEVYEVTGSGAMTRLRIQGVTGSVRMHRGAHIYLIVGAGATWTTDDTSASVSDSDPGCIKPLTTGARAVGTVAHFVNSGNVWHEV